MNEFRPWKKISVLEKKCRFASGVKSPEFSRGLLTTRFCKPALILLDNPKNAYLCNLPLE